MWKISQNLLGRSAKKVIQGQMAKISVFLCVFPTNGKFNHESTSEKNCRSCSSL